MSENEQRRRLQRVSTGVPGLDEVLAGGFLQGGVYIVVGPPGAGKTILANQIAYHHGHSSSVAYVTLLAESHSRLLSHLEELSFFEEGQIAKTVHYLSGYR